METPTSIALKLEQDIDRIENDREHAAKFAASKDSEYPYAYGQLRVVTREAVRKLRELE